MLRGLWFLAGFLASLLLGWFVVAPLVSKAVRRRNRNNPTIEEAISRYVRLLAVLVAGQTVIGSLVSGVVLVFDPEFNVGNYIEWSDGEGTVRSITLRVTRVHTRGGELITVPNTVLTSEAVTRPYGQGRQRDVFAIRSTYARGQEPPRGCRHRDQPGLKAGTGGSDRRRRGGMSDGRLRAPPSRYVPVAAGSSTAGTRRSRDLDPDGRRFPQSCGPSDVCCRR